MPRTTIGASLAVLVVPAAAVLALVAPAAPETATTPPSRA